MSTAWRWATSGSTIPSWRLSKMCSAAPKAFWGPTDSATRESTSISGTIGSPFDNHAVGFPRPGFTRVPVKVRDGHLLMFDVRLAGVRTKAMLDTGAQATIGNNSLRAALARRARRGVSEQHHRCDARRTAGRDLRAPPINIGGVTIRGMRVTFADMLHLRRVENEQRARVAHRHGRHRPPRFTDHRLQAQGIALAGAALAARRRSACSKHADSRQLSQALLRAATIQLIISSSNRCTSCVCDATVADRSVLTPSPG